MFNLPTVLTYLDLKSYVLARRPADLDGYTPTIPLAKFPFNASPVPYCPTKHIWIVQPWARSRVKSGSH